MVMPLAGRVMAAVIGAVGWQVNYERAAYTVAAAAYAPPALWSGPLRHHTAPIPPIRPPLGRPPQ